MKTYKADGSFRQESIVHVVGPEGRRRPLPIRKPAGEAYPKSPDGHSWGYGGSGPYQLAQDILWDVYGSEPAPTLAQLFKFDVIARFPQDVGFALTEERVRDWVYEHGGFVGVREAQRA